MLTGAAASIASPALALQQSVMTAYTMTEVSGSPSLSSGLAASPVGTSQESLNYRIDGIQKYFNYAGGVSVRQPNYGNFIVRDRTGQEHTLRELGNTGNEIASDQTIEAVVGDHRATLGWSGLLSASPLGYHALNASYQHGFFGKSTLLGVQLTYLNQQQPETYFIDRDLRSRSRPRVIHGNEAVVTLDQVLSERWKMSLDLSTAERTEERPRNIGVTLGQAYALANRLTVQGRARRFAELRGQSLKNERGYFTMSQGEIGLIYEPVYDLLVSASYGLGVESEHNPDTGIDQIAASDQYGLGVKYSFRDYEILAQGSLNQGNTSYQSSSFTGGFTWKL